MTVAHHCSYNIENYTIAKKEDVVHYLLECPLLCTLNLDPGFGGSCQMAKSLSLGSYWVAVLTISIGDCCLPEHASGNRLFQYFGPKNQIQVIFYASFVTFFQVQQFYENIV